MPRRRLCVSYQVSITGQILNSKRGIVNQEWCRFGRLRAAPAAAAARQTSDAEAETAASVNVNVSLFVVSLIISLLNT